MEPVKEYFEQYTQDVRILEINFDNDNVKDKNGNICIPYTAANDGFYKIVYSIYNPRNYDFEYELRLSSDAQEILDSKLGESKSNEWHIEFCEDNKVAEVYFSKDLLRNLEGGHFLNPTLQLIDRETRRIFPEASLILKVNSKPPVITNAVIMLIEQPLGSGIFEYVICLDLPSKSSVSMDGVHKDIESLSLKELNGVETRYTVSDGSMKIDESGVFWFKNESNPRKPYISTNIESALIPIETNGNEVFSSKSGQPAYILTGIRQENSGFEMTVKMQDADGLTSSKTISDRVEKLDEVKVMTGTDVIEPNQPENMKTLKQDDNAVCRIEIIPPDQSLVYNTESKNWVVKSSNLSDVSVNYEIYTGTYENESIEYGDTPFAEGFCNSDYQIEVPLVPCQILVWAKKEGYSDSNIQKYFVSPEIQKVFVEKNGQDKAGRGSRYYPVKSLSYIFSSNMLSSKNDQNNEINVLSDCSEDIVIPKNSTVRITGHRNDNEHLPVLDGSVCIDSDCNVVMENINFSNCQDDAITLSEGSLLLKNICIEKCLKNGLVVNNGNLEAERLSITNCSDSGILVTGTNPKITLIEDVTIVGNKYCGMNFNTDKSCTAGLFIGGKENIEGNGTGEIKNLLLHECAEGIISKISILSALDEDSRIGISISDSILPTLENPVIFTQGFNDNMEDENPSEYFFCDDAELYVSGEEEGVIIPLEKEKQKVVYIDSDNENPDFNGEKLLKDGTIRYPFNSIKGAFVRIAELNDGESDFELQIISDMVLKDTDLYSEKKTFGFFESEKKLNLAIKSKDGFMKKISADKKGRHFCFIPRSDAVFNISIENIELADGLFNDGNGGCVLVSSENTENNSVISLCNAKISNCNALNGGGIHAENFKVFLKESSSIMSCNAKNSGGAIWLKNAETVLNGEIKNNSADGDKETGGGIYLSECKLKITDGADISGNSSGNKLGAAIHALTNAEIIFSGNVSMTIENDILVSDLNECSVFLEGTPGSALNARISLDSCLKSIYEEFITSQKTVVESIGEYALTKSDIEKFSLTDINDHSKASRNYLLELKNNKGTLCSKSNLSVQIGLHPDYCFELTPSSVSRKSPENVSFVFKVKCSDGEYVEYKSDNNKISLWQGGYKLLTNDDCQISGGSLEKYMPGTYQIEMSAEFNGIECISTKDFVITD